MATARFRANINPAVLKWARETAKLSVQRSAQKAGVKQERYAAWEDPNDDAKPTIRQLRNIANAFHRPVSLFYLRDVPHGFQPMKDLRRIPGDDLLLFSPALAFEMELAQQRRELSLDLTSASGEEVEPFRLHASLDEDPEEVGHRIRTTLAIRFSDQVQWTSQGPLEPFNVWRRAIESLDVLVFQMSRVESTEACGFALAAEVRPMIVVNRKDVPNRRTFSLLHEFAHLLLRQSGASTLDWDAIDSSSTQSVEVFCNATAAAALIPRERLLEIDIVKKEGNRSTGWREIDLKDLSHKFGVSREAILRRLLTFDRTTPSYYKYKAAQWLDEWKEKQISLRRQRQDGNKEFRRNPSADVFYELGRPFVCLVFESVNANVMTLHEASGHLGNLRLRHFSKLEQRAYAG